MAPLGVEEYGANVRYAKVGEEALALVAEETLSAIRLVDMKTEGGAEDAKNCKRGVRLQYARADVAVVGFSASFGYVSVKWDPAGCSTGDVNKTSREMTAEG
jgi:hypothetical protein